MYRKDILDKKDTILEWINQKKSKSFISKEIKCDIKTLDNWLKKQKIEYKGLQAWSTGKKFPNKWKSVYDYLKKDTIIGSYSLKRMLFRTNIKEKKCEKCKRIKWNGIDIPLHLHHKDGDKTNNELCNLQILCANCHGQTDNFGGKKLKKLEKIRNVNLNYCCCGKIISKNAKKCKSCVGLNQKRKVYRPSLQILIQDIKENSYLEVGKKYNVSDNCIRKWVKNYGKIPPKKFNHR